MKHYLRIFTLSVFSLFFAGGNALAVEINDEFNISGFVIASYGDNSNAATGEGVFDSEGHLVFDFHPNDKIQVLLDLEFAHNPAHEGAGEFSEDDGIEGEGEIFGAIEFERAFIKYSHSAPLNLTLGQFFSPTGLWVPVHWPILMPTIKGPIFFQNNKSYVGGNVQVGTKFSGDYDLTSDLSIQYATWLTRGKQAHGTDEIESKFNNYGGDVRFDYKGMATIGLFYQNNAATVALDVDQDTLGVFGQANFMDDTIKLQAEYVSTSVEGKYASAGAQLRDLDAFYVSAEYVFLEDFSVYYRYDQGDDVKGAGTGSLISDPDPLSVNNTIALNWNPYIGTRVWVEYHHQNFDTDGLEDNKTWILSVGQLF